MAQRIHDLLELPKSVRKGDFVQSLASGIEHPTETVKSYAVTSAILQTFEHALTIIDSALKTGASQAAYLHGSFGSGKSHFMAILDLMLANHDAPWSRAEFHPLKPKFDWIGDKKLLQLPMHFLDATSIEEKIFDTYVRWVEANRPDASVPALYTNRDLFENAQSLRKNLGDERFFEGLNSGKKVSGSWGGLAASATWDGERFETTVNGSDDREREQLFSALVKTHFPAFARQTSRFIKLDLGLQVLARHAKGLGYDGVVLYLDELILWLASSASDLSLIQREAKKLVNLKEGQNDRREIPIVSFIARQRDLAQLIGEAHGNERAALEDSLKHHSGRFETIMLTDSNLPAIVEHRVLRPKDDAAKETLADGFARVWRSAGDARSTLIGSVGNEEAFKKVFPFSPALVESLVALSDCLQRERTAIRILMELLVEHLPELELGPVVPVGDAFDVIAGGEDPFDQLMRARFDRARHIYQYGFLPLIQAEHGTETADVCQRLRDTHPKKLGCSGCPKTACRNDNRLAKTLLMAALVPGAETFKGLTVKKLVHLNHGTIASPIPGAEVQLAAEKLRRWGAQVGPLRVGDQADPELALHLEGIDLSPVIDRTREFDTPGARRQKLRKLLFEALDLPADSTTVEHTATYRGTRREGVVRFGNVREMSDDQLRCPAGAEWYLVLDYPFDQGDHSPDDDIVRVEEYREKTDREEPTLVWLPTFFSHRLEQTLGDYVSIDHILDGRTQEYLGHLRPEDQIQARSDLTSLRDQKRDQIVRALDAAYGLTTKENNPALDLSRTVEEHILPLSSSMQVGALLAGSLKDGIQQALERLLEHLYPHHPHFPATVTAGKLGRVRILVERLLETQDRRMPVTAQDRKELQNYADPLGLTQTTESRAILQDKSLNDLDQRRQQASLDAPTVADVRGYTDPDGYRGLTLELQDLLVWTYALWSGRSMVRAGRDVTLTRLGQLPEDAELIRPELPTEEEWETALTRSAELFGVTFANRHLSARNLASLCQKLGESAAKSKSATDLDKLLGSALDDWADRSAAPRLTTAQSASTLIGLVNGSDGADRVRRIASYQPETSATAVSRSLKTAADVVGTLRSESRWLNFQSVRGLLADPRKQARAQAILDDLAAALRSDELNKPLGAALAELTSRTAELITPPRRDWEPVASESTEVSGATGYSEALSALAERLTTEAANVSEDVALKLEVNAVLLKRKKREE